MKKIVTIVLTSILLLAAVGCVCGGTAQTVSHRGELAVAYDNALTKELLAFFQANQDCIVSGTMLNEQTDYAKLSDVSVAVLKDEAIVTKLLDAGWTETENWTDAQKTANGTMFGFTVLNAPNITTNGKEAAKLLTDWLVGDGTYEKTLTTPKSCGCGSTQTTIKIKSDAPTLVQNEKFKALKSN